MNRHIRPLSILLVALLAAFTPHLPAQGRPVTADDRSNGEAWWSHVKVLADDRMEGA
jgi:hypothetical protein